MVHIYGHQDFFLRQFGYTTDQPRLIRRIVPRYASTHATNRFVVHAKGSLLEEQLVIHELTNPLLLVSR